MNDHERFIFDTNGYFIVEGVLANEQVEALRATIRQGTEQFDPVAKENHPLHWGKAWRDLLDVPVISEYLEALVGNHALYEGRREARGDDALPTFRLDHVNVHTHVKNGFKGMPLHGGWRGTGGSQFFRYHDGRFYNGLVVVAYELFDTSPNGGGFCCIPGSHKANLPLPGEWTAPGSAPDGLVKKIPARPGDAIIFTETLIHGTAAWNVDAPRKTLFYKFSPHGTSWSSDFFEPADFAIYEDMDNRKLAILEAPNARYKGRPTAPVFKQSGDS
ncbi:MAG: phytanoyl-CoA dioxygenase family protein [Pseudomonadota bacterium]